MRIAALQSFHHRLQGGGGYHFTHAISSYIAIEQLSAKQATREEVAITQSLFKFREFVQPAYGLAATRPGFHSMHNAPDL